MAIEYQWRTIIGVFFSGFFGSWIVFGIVYFFITQYYRIEEVGLLEKTYMKLKFQNAAHYRPCIMNVDSFVTALLFSLESQATIGYGHRLVVIILRKAFINRIYIAALVL